MEVSESISETRSVKNVALAAWSGSLSFGEKSPTLMVCDARAGFALHEGLPKPALFFDSDACGLGGTPA